MDEIIKIKIDSFSYHDKPQLTDINLNIVKGEFIVLTGLSGCGKTTLTRIINGLIPDFYEGTLNGDVLIFNKNIHSYKKGEIAKYMRNVFQNPSDQFFSTIAEDEIALVGENLGMNTNLLRKKVEDAMIKLNIKDLKGKSVFELSGGQRQKVAIASTLVYDTDIIIFDEPSASLDYKSTDELRNIMKLLKSLGKTIIVAEHRLYYLKELMDRLIIMKDGKISNIYKKDELTDLVRKENNLRCFDEENLISEKDTAYKNFLNNKNTSNDDYNINKENNIEIKNLNVCVRKKHLAENISFSLSNGECMGIIGKNGIGKTTMTKQLTGLLSIKSGYTSYGNSKKERIKNVYYVMQDSSIQLFSHTVEHEIIPKNKLNDQDYLEKAKKYLKSLDLWEKRNMHPQELSVGEKQRLAIITAFLSDKKIIILDEPTAGLDYKRMNMVAEHINEKSKETPIILITHDLELLFKSCNTVLLMSEKNSEKINVKGNEEKILNFIKM